MRWTRILRRGRGAIDPPTQVGNTGIWRCQNAIVDLYACRTEAGIVLFDAGLDPKGRPVDALLEALDGTREDVTHVLLTHGHPDHVAAAPLFPRARVRAGAADTNRLSGAMKGTKRAERMFRRLFPVPPVTTTDPLQGETSIDVGDELVHAFPTPGDTPGAYTYWCRSTLIVGDIMDLRNGALRPAHDFATDDPAQNLATIAGLPERLTHLPLEFVCTSHGGPTPTGRAGPMLDAVAERAREQLATATSG